MTVMPVAEWCPDAPDLSEYTNIALNVVALTPESYGPINNLVQFSSNALEGTCIGMGFAEDTSPATHIFAGTASALEILTQGGSAWNDVSGGTYAAAAGENWRFAQYNNLMLATDFSDPIQSYDMIAGGAFGVLSAGAPHARFIAVAKTFAIVANTNDPVGGPNPARLWWSGAGEPTAWPTPGSTTAQQKQSDFSDLTGPQGDITGLAPNLAGCDCAVFFERGVFRMIYGGPPDIFDFYPAASVRGCPAPNSIVQLGMLVAYYGEDGFYVFDGNQSQPIGANKVDKWFAANVDQSALNLLVGAADVANKAYVWIFRSIYAPSVLQDTMLVYRWDIQRWSSASLQTQWIARSPVPNVQPGVSLVPGQLQLAAISGSATGSLLDIQTEAGSDLQTENGVDLLTEQSFALLLAYFSGTPLPAQVGTKVVQINPAGRAFVNATRPLVNSAGSGLPLLIEPTGLTLLTEAGFPITTEASGAVVTVAMSARTNYYDQEAFGPEVAPNSMGECPQRSDGRYHRGRISIPSGIWTTMFGLDVTGIRAGLR